MKVGSPTTAQSRGFVNSSIGLDPLLPSDQS